MKPKTRVLTEKQIAEAVRDGSHEGQTELVSRYAAQVFSMIVKQVPNVMDAQELAQDTFLKAFSRIGSYDARRASLSTWLCCIAYRLTLDFMKRHRQPVVTIEDDEDWPADINDKQLETDLSTGREERIEQLEKLIDLLPADERMLLTLYYFDDRPLAEIAYITGIDTKALANRLYRIRKKLYKQMR